MSQAMRLLIVGLVAVAFVSGCGVSSSAYLERMPVESIAGSSDATLMAELERYADKYIRDRLKNPYSAKFHSNQATRLQPGTKFGFRKIGEDEHLFRVVTRVEATNSFGAFLVSNYITVARYNPELHVWEVIYPPMAQ